MIYWVKVKRLEENFPYLGSGSTAGIEALARLAATGIEIGFDPEAMGGGEDPFADYFNKVEVAGLGKVDEFFKWADEQIQRGVKTVKIQGEEISLIDYKVRLEEIRSRKQQLEPKLFATRQVHGVGKMNELLERPHEISVGLSRLDGKNSPSRVKAESAVITAELRREITVKALEDQRRLREEERRARISGLLQTITEIKEFANQKSLFPLGPNKVDVDSRNLSTRVISDPQLLKKAEIFFGYNQYEGADIIEMKYGYKGQIINESLEYPSDDRGSEGPTRTIHSSEVINWYGIRLKEINWPGDSRNGEIFILRQEEVYIPGRSKAGWKGSGRSSGWEEAVAPYIGLRENWITMPNDEESRKLILAEAFHDPVYLRSEPFYPDTQEREASQTPVNETPGEVSSFNLAKLISSFFK